MAPEIDPSGKAIFAAFGNDSGVFGVIPGGQG